MVQRQRMTRRALLAVGGDDRHLAEWLGSLLEAVETVGEDSIVIGEEQAHQRSPAGDSSSRSRSRSSSSMAASVSTLSTSRDTRRSSPALRWSFSFCRAPSIVYFSV